MARPRKNLSDDQIRQIGKLAGVLTVDQIADYLGISDRTLRRRMSDPRILSAYQKGKSAAIAGVAASLLRQTRKGNVTAMIFYLKTQARWKETEREMPLADLNGMSDEQLAEIAAAGAPTLKLG